MTQAQANLVKNQLAYYKEYRKMNPAVDNFPQLEVIFEILAQKQDSLEAQVAMLTSSVATRGIATTPLESFTAQQGFVIQESQRVELGLLIRQVIWDYFKSHQAMPLDSDIDQLISLIQKSILTWLIDYGLRTDINLPMEHGHVQNTTGN